MSKASGKYFREGMSLTEAVEFFNDAEATEQFFIENIAGLTELHARFRLTEHIERRELKPQPFHCEDCFNYFSVKTNTLMHASRLSLGKWYGKGRGLKGKAIIVGMKDQPHQEGSRQGHPQRPQGDVQGFVMGCPTPTPTAQVYADGHPSYPRLPSSSVRKFNTSLVSTFA